MSQPAKTQQSKAWGDTAKNRFIKQHGSIDEIPEGDAHAVPVYNNPVEPKKATPEEQKAAEERLQKQINELKSQGAPIQNQNPVPPQPKGNNFYDEWID